MSSLFKDCTSIFLSCDSFFTNHAFAFLFPFRLVNQLLRYFSWFPEFASQMPSLKSRSPAILMFMLNPHRRKLKQHAIFLKTRTAFPLHHIRNVWLTEVNCQMLVGVLIQGSSINESGINWYTVSIKIK